MLAIKGSSGAWLSLVRGSSGPTLTAMLKSMSASVQGVSCASPQAPLESIRMSAPLEIVCNDFWTAENSNNRSVHVLVVTDHFTRLVQALPCLDQSAKQLARQLWDKYFYGFPERIHSDQGLVFESQFISELLKVAGIRKSHTTHTTRWAMAAWNASTEYWVI